MPALERIVIVGASLAGLRAAETLRAEGFVGSLTLVGDEDHAPYDRPPLSKQVLRGEWDAERVALPAGQNEAFDLTWERGVAATGLDLEACAVALADGRSLPFDGLVIATGARPWAAPLSRASRNPTCPGRLQGGTIFFTWRTTRLTSRDFGKPSMSPKPVTTM